MSTPPLSIRKLLHSILLSKGRMEALTDGIFAISMTLLVLELKVPDLPKSVNSSELLHKIGEEAPAFFSFMVSFLYCGLLWVLHHLAMHFVRHLQIVLVWMNLLFLMSVAVVPFSCGLLGHFPHNRVAQEIYFGNLFVAAALITLQWIVAKKKKLINEDDPRASRAMGEQLMFFPVALGAAMLAAYFKPEAGFYALALALSGMRVWQKYRTATEPKNPERASS